MTFFHSISQKIFKKTPKILRIDEGGFRVMGGVRFARRYAYHKDVMVDAEDDYLMGKFYSLDFFGVRFTFRLWVRPPLESGSVIIFRNYSYKKPPYNEISLEWHERFNFTITPAYSGYLEK